MTAIKLQNFAGLAPIITPTRLADNVGAIANNTRFDNGGVRPWKGASDVLTLSGTSGAYQFIYKYLGTWFGSTFPSQVAPSIFPGDVHSRIYFTDAGYPKVRSGNNTYRLGLPRPPAPTISITVPGDSSVLTYVRSQSYVVCFVDKFGVEGPSSLPTNSVEVGKDSTVTLDTAGCLTAGNYNIGLGAYLRIYRDNVGGDGAIYQYVTDIPYAQASYADSTDPENLQEALQSEVWIAAPDDDSSLYPSGPLASLIALPGGILAGHSGNTVYLSVPNVPTAWPYSYTVRDPIVGIVLIQGGIFICTTGRPMLLTGSDPVNMVAVPVESFEACVNARSIVDMGDYALYASPRGLVAAQGNTATLATEGMFDSVLWQAFYSSDTVRAYNYEGKYVAFYGTAAAGTGFIFDPEAKSIVTFTGISATAGAMDSATGDLFLADNRTGSTHVITKFNAGTPLTYTWKSKDFISPVLSSFHCIRVQAQSYPITLTIIADGITRGPYVFPNSDAVKLPGGFRARTWSFILSGTGSVDYVQAADSLVEIE